MIKKVSRNESRVARHERVRRKISGTKDIPRVLNGLGIAIISTSKGVMTDKEARKENIGGEVLAYIW